MYIQRRTLQKWVIADKSLRDETHLLAGLRFSRLKVAGTTALRKARQQTNVLRQHHNLKSPQALA
jgi:hypothetical protein